MTASELAKSSGLNLYGHLSTSIGLGAAARNTADVIVSQGIPLASVNVVPLPAPRQQAVRAEWNVIPRGHRPPYPINIFHMNPPEIAALLTSSYVWRVPLLRRANVAVPFWELSRLPSAWTACLANMDAILAPSLFILDLCHRTLPWVPAFHYPQGVSLPREVRESRGRWGMRDGDTVFVCSFDLRSDLQRKNPLGVIRAFRSAFTEADRVELVIRPNHADTPDVGDDLQRLKSAAGGNVRLILGNLTYTEVLCLYASADVYVSLHRAEGLGLGLLEAMSYGKPVIATAYSGSMDFVDDQVGFLIGYELVSVEPTRAYPSKLVGPDQEWAEPVLAEAVDAMRHLHFDADLRKTMGEGARLRVRELNEMHRGTHVFTDLETMRLRGLPAGHRSGVRSLTRAGRMDSMKRSVVHALRQMGLKPPAPAGELLPLYPVVTGPEGLTLARESS